MLREVKSWLIFKLNHVILYEHAGVMELVVMRDSKSRVARREGSTPSLGTLRIYTLY